VESYVHNLKLKLEDKPYDHGFIKNFNFNEEEQAYLNSLFNLDQFLDKDTPLIHLMNKGYTGLVSHLLNFSKIRVDVNETKLNQTLFVCFTTHFLSLPLEELSRNYLNYQNEISHLFINGYQVKEDDFKFIKQFKARKDSRQLQYIMFASYALKLAEPNLIKVLMDHIRLFTSLTCIKTGKHIGFYKTIEKQVLESTQNSSAFQNEIINYISKNKKTEFKAIENKLLEMRRSKYEVIEDPQLREVLKRLI
jgi:hypothetical protein